MDKTMYETNVSPDMLKKKKTSFTLDLDNNNSVNGRIKRAKQVDVRDGVLCSPDVGLLKLGTPELERFIIQQTAGGQTTATMVPTPTQILFPRVVTEEQEAYARGFVDALVELHKQQGTLIQATDIKNVNATSYATMQPVPRLIQLSSDGESSKIKLSQLSNGISSGIPRPISLNLSTASRISSSLHQPVGLNLTNAKLSAGFQAYLQQDPSKTLIIPRAPVLSSPLTSSKRNDTAQMVPNYNDRDSPSLSPIDMSSQERIKQERKREKNRYAARKCRTRKLERISRLEDRVKALKGQNYQLASSATGLREHVSHLRQMIVDHVNGGCQVMMLRDSA